MDKHFAIIYLRTMTQNIDKGDGPALEIEITPAMIEAGTEALALFDFGDPAEWIIGAIYCAMESAKSQEVHLDQ